MQAETGPGYKTKNNIIVGGGGPMRSIINNSDFGLCLMLVHTQSGEIGPLMRIPRVSTLRFLLGLFLHRAEGDFPAPSSNC